MKNAIKLNGKYVLLEIEICEILYQCSTYNCTSTPNSTVKLLTPHKTTFMSHLVLTSSPLPEQACVNSYAELKDCSLHHFVIAGVPDLAVQVAALGVKHICRLPIGLHC